MRYLNSNNPETGLVPSYSFPLAAVPADPLAVLARELPTSVASVMHHDLSVRKAEARLSTMRSISHDHAAMACAWLHTRRAGERSVLIESGGDASPQTWCRRGESARFATRVTIW